MTAKDTNDGKNSFGKSLIGYGLPVLAFFAAIATAFFVSLDEHGYQALIVAIVAAAITLAAAVSQSLRERTTSRLGKKLSDLTRRITV